MRTSVSILIFLDEVLQVYIDYEFHELFSVSILIFLDEVLQGGVSVSEGDFFESFNPYFPG